MRTYKETQTNFVSFPGYIMHLFYCSNLSEVIDAWRFLARLPYIYLYRILRQQRIISDSQPNLTLLTPYK